MKLVVIADEITAVGWRLAGAQVQMPDARTVGESFGTALRSADLVLITAALAARLAGAQLQAALLSQRPLVLVIADLQREFEPPDIEVEVRHALGVAI
jgi:vacuolar-type H+-ATPase subunit F/Vma7